MKSICKKMAAALLSAALLAGLAGCGKQNAGTSRAQSATEAPPTGSSTQSAGASSTPVAQAGYTALPLPEEMRAMWVSFLEWEKHDIATETAMRATAGEMFDNCKAAGLNTVIVAVRSFADALYKSEMYPWSHLITGVQGQDPGYDPLAVLVEEAHARGLRLEAMVNPYRARHALYASQPLAADNPAALHPEWVREVAGTMWFDPGIPEVQQMVVAGVREIAAGYDVDGIHFDDYFYTGGTDESFDAQSYAQYGGGTELAAWRRGNINAMVQSAYAAVKAANPTVSFGISPSGNNDNNYNQEYIDVKLWMSSPGYVDYIMPQLYWGFGHQLSNGSQRFAFNNIAQEWAGFARDPSVRLYAGLAAYNIGMLQADGSRTDFGGNGAGENSEWESGHCMADQVQYLRGVAGFSGFALFRYDFLFQPGDPVSEQERQALLAVL